MVQVTDRHVSEEAMALKAASVVCERSKAPLIKASRLAFQVLRRPDIEKAARFFIDFGLLVEHRERNAIYFRGHTRDGIILKLKKGPHALEGFGVEASKDDLETLSRETGTDIQERDDPIGGAYVELNDPDGLVIEVCCGITQLAPIPDVLALAAANKSDAIHRVGETVRNQIEPKAVHKLGHSVVGAAKIKVTAEWYQRTLGMIVSDFQFLPNDPTPVVAFLRFDTGDTPTDHHSIGIGSAIETGHNHTAFEMAGFEEIAVAGEWVRRRNYTHGWGIGRHVLGSQIFDYWREPGGELFEHYADGDVFTASAATGYHMFHGDAQHQWGPKISKEFTGENRRMDMLKSIFKRVRTDDDLTLARVKRMLKAVSK